MAFWVWGGKQDCQECELHNVDSIDMQIAPFLDGECWKTLPSSLRRLALMLAVFHKSCVEQELGAREQMHPRLAINCPLCQYVPRQYIP